MEDKIIINQVNPETFEFQDYSTSDESLIVSNDLDTAFSSSIDYIEAYIIAVSKLRHSLLPMWSLSV